MAGLFDLTGKTAVVVGGTSGIGLAMALGLADAGADVVASSRRQEQVDEAAKQIEARGRRSLRVASDVADRSEPAGAVRCDDRGVRQGGYPDQLGGQDQARADRGFSRGRVELDHGHERDGDAAGVPDLREEDAGTRVTGGSSISRR